MVNFLSNQAKLGVTRYSSALITFNWKFESVIFIPNIRLSGSQWLNQTFCQLWQYFDSLLALHAILEWNIYSENTIQYQSFINFILFFLRSQTRNSTSTCSSCPSPIARSSTTSQPSRSFTSTSTNTTPRWWTPWTRAPTPGSWAWDTSWSL